jgi:hypothetical protein
MTKRERQLSDLLQQELEHLDQNVQEPYPDIQPSMEQVEVLKPALEAARWMQDRRNALEARPGYLAAGRLRLLARIRAGVTFPAGRTSAMREFSWRRLGFQLLLICLLFLAGFLVAEIMTAASRTWLPGDPPYVLKLAHENLALQLAAGPARRASLHIE